MLWECVQGGKATEAVTEGGGRRRVWRYPAHGDKMGGAECVGRDPVEVSKLSLIRVGVSRSQEAKSLFKELNLDFTQH